MNFPPRTQKNKIIDTVLACMRSAITKDKVVYVSTPITSGKRYLKYKMSKSKNYIGKQHDRELKRAVITPNIKHARKKINEISGKLHQIQIINPTAIEVNEWTQEDYACFWKGVINNFVDQIVFLNEWQYSNGCSFEFFTAVEKRIPVFSENLEPLSKAEGIGMISDAIQEIKCTGGNTDFLENLLQVLRQNYSMESV